MKIAVISAAVYVAITPVATAQSGGYPASPSHGITGTNPDGTPRYGKEPNEPGPNTGGRSGAAAPDDRSTKDAAREGSDASKHSGK